MELPTPSLCHPNNHPTDPGPPPFDATVEPHLASTASPTVACNRLVYLRAASLGAPWSHPDFHEMGRLQHPPLIHLPLKTKSRICCAGR